MSYQEKKNIVSLISTILIFGFYCLYVFQKYKIGSIDSTELPLLGGRHLNLNPGVDCSKNHHYYCIQYHL